MCPKCKLDVEIIEYGTDRIICKVNSEEKKKRIEIDSKTCFYLRLYNNCGILDNVFCIEQCQVGQRHVKIPDTNVLHCYTCKTICGYGKYRTSPFCVYYVNDAKNKYINEKQVKIIFRKHLIKISSGGIETYIPTDETITIKFKLQIVP